ncbi:MAG: outer membrane protein assembly factor BamC [Leptothrix ochracea]|uniref:outer membrane protein assembly factor BamC n=1 Tax=Leptothrix ochracea TaxID=735331 RepID=UPI0034E2C109
MTLKRMISTPLTFSPSLLNTRGWCVTALSLGLVGLAGCASDTPITSKLDYRTVTVHGPIIEIPPDLTQLNNDPRYQPMGGGGEAISANAAGKAASGVTDSTSVRTTASLSRSGVRVERDGNQRWLVSPKQPEDIWPILHSFWSENGFKISFERPEIGIMDTDWAENRAKLPQDFIRRAVLSKIAEDSYDTGERDRYHTRIERIPGGGTEIYVSHRGIADVGAGAGAGRFQSRQNDPSLEAEMLSRLMLRLANLDAVAQPSGTALASQASAAVRNATPTTAPRARILPGKPAASMQMDEAPDRAWRRLGVALDRSGFTVEDRDRSQGIYDVRYVDPKLAGKEEPGFLSKIFTGTKSEGYSGTRYRLILKELSATSSIVSIYDPQGSPQNDDNAHNIITMLVNEMR